MDLTDTEPAKTVGAQGAVIGLVVAVVALVTSLGFDVSADTLKGIVAVIAGLFVVAPYLTALRIRGKVFAPATVVRKVIEAHDAGLAGRPIPKVKGS